MCSYFANIYSIISVKRSNAIQFSPLCPQNNTFGGFTPTKTNILTLPLETEASEKLLPFVFTFGSPLFFSLPGSGKTMRRSKS